MAGASGMNLELAGEEISSLGHDVVIVADAGEFAGAFECGKGFLKFGKIRAVQIKGTGYCRSRKGIIGQEFEQRAFKRLRRPPGFRWILPGRSFALWSSPVGVGRGMSASWFRLIGLIGFGCESQLSPLIALWSGVSRSFLSRLMVRFSSRCTKRPW